VQCAELHLSPCFKKYIFILALEMASPGNQHCANCIGTLSFPIVRVLPEEGDLIAEAGGDVAVQHVVADVRDRTLHPSDPHRTRSRVEVIVQKAVLLRRLFPVEVAGDVGPEAGRVLDGTRVHGTVLFHARAVRVAADVVGRTEQAAVGVLSRRIHVRHFRTFDYFRNNNKTVYSPKPHRRQRASAVPSTRNIE